MAQFEIMKGDGDYYNLKVSGARLIFKNFSGKGSEFNAEGSRNVCMVVDNEQIYDILLKDGWRFRTQKREDGSYAEPFEELANGRVAFPYTQLRLNYASQRPPKVYLHTSANRHGDLLNEATVSELDYAYITDAKLLINPSHWEVRGERGTKGYINVMHVTIEDDPFAADYPADDIELDSEEDIVPFS